MSHNFTIKYSTCPTIVHFVQIHASCKCAGNETRDVASGRSYNPKCRMAVTFTRKYHNGREGKGTSIVKIGDDNCSGAIQRCKPNVVHHDEGCAFHGVEGAGDHAGVLVTCLGLLCTQDEWDCPTFYVKSNKQIEEMPAKVMLPEIEKFRDEYIARINVSGGGVAESADGNEEGDESGEEEAAQLPLAVMELGWSMAEDEIEEGDDEGERGNGDTDEREDQKMKIEATEKALFEKETARKREGSREEQAMDKQGQYNKCNKCPGWLSLTPAAGRFDTRTT